MFDDKYEWMPSCVECGCPVSDLYREFSKGNIRLTQCHRCGNFADRYVEYEFVVIFIDMILHKSQVYRHLLFNRLDYSDTGFDATVASLTVLWMAFDAGFRWLQLYAPEYGAGFGNVGKALATVDWRTHGTTIMSGAALVLTSLLLETLAFHMGVLLAIRAEIGSRYAIIKYNYATTALLLSSFAKTILIPMLIWDYHDLSVLWMVNVFVTSSNTQAISVFLSVSHQRAFFIILAGWAMRLLAQLLFHLVVPSMPVWWLY